MPHSEHFRRTRAATALVAVSSLALTSLIGMGVTPAQASPTPKAKAAAPAPDTREAGADVQSKVAKLSTAEKKEFAAEAKSAASVGRQLRARVAAADTGTGGATVGSEKTWLVLDGTDNSYSPATYVLRALKPHIEVWVQKDLNYPAGDCRNDGVRNVVTTPQAQGLADEFENNILPKESKAFSVATPRDGTKQVPVFSATKTLTELLGKGDPNYFKGAGDKTVALVSNVRDENFYEPTTPAGSTFIAGFFSPTYKAAFDRNIMSIDSYDWLHRTGANPPNDATSGSLCSSKQPARPRDYEATFAHEYQHLLESDRDSDEVTWLNEGLSDYAQSVVGYVDTRIQYPDPDYDSHIACFEGFLGSASFPYCGAEQSLTRWEDQGSPSILADYGAAYAFLTYIAGEFGQGAISYLHRNPANGLASLQNYLDDRAPGLKSMDVVHDWEAAMALDGWLDDGAKGLTKDQKARFTSPELHAAIDWSWTGSYDSAGAPANGSDYVVGVAGRPVNANTLKSINFTGTKGYAPDKLAWTVNDGALYAGEGDELDRSAVYDVSVPAGSPALTFSSKYDIEEGWDFGVVQVSTDGGKTYKSLAGTHTTTAHNADAEARIVRELPGLTGTSAAYRTESYNLSAYAGKKVLLAFRYLTDGGANGNGGTGPTGWWVKDVKVGSTVVTSGSTLAGARSATQVSPIPVAGWSVQMVGWSLDGKVVRYRDLKLDKNNHVAHSRAWLKKRFKGVDRVGFIVSVDDPTETATRNANYVLKVNNVVQPGGAGDTTVTPTDGVAATKAFPRSARRVLR